MNASKHIFARANRARVSKMTAHVFCVFSIDRHIGKTHKMPRTSIQQRGIMIGMRNAGASNAEVCLNLFRI